jgi:hypothetical protein
MIIRKRSRARTFLPAHLSGVRCIQLAAQTVRQFSRALAALLQAHEKLALGAQRRSQQQIGLFRAPRGRAQAGFLRQGIARRAGTVGSGLLPVLAGERRVGRYRRASRGRWGQRVLLRVVALVVRGDHLARRVDGPRGGARNMGSAVDGPVSVVRWLQEE